MNSSYEPCPILIDPFIIHFLSSTIEPPPPLPASVFFYDPFLVVPPPPPPPSPLVIDSSISSQSSTKLIITNRHRFTPLQLFTLHRIFMQLPYPSLEQRRLIAQHLHIDIEQVRVWFSNRRSRQRCSSQQANLITPTSNEHLNLKQLFDQLHLII